MLILSVMKHAPETCPAYNPKYRQITRNLYEKAESLAAKHGVKLIGIWTDHPQHTAYSVMEAPNMETFMKLMMEPEIMAGLSFCTAYTTTVLSQKEALELLKKA
jgi:L-rhamnose mutarotase